MCVLQINAGQAVVVNWFADATYKVTYSAEGDWVGLYRKGECDDSPSWNSGKLSLGGQVAGERHKCYLDQKNIPRDLTEGQVLRAFGCIAIDLCNEWRRSNFLFLTLVSGIIFDQAFAWVRLRMHSACACSCTCACAGGVLPRTS